MKDIGPESVPDVKKITLKALKEIPEGKVTAYKDVAEALGDTAAARAVGTIMANNSRPEEYPCWRVVHADGRVGKYSRESGTEGKIRKMRKEGIPVSNGRIENFSDYRFRGFSLAPPLPKLREIQKEVPKRVEIDETFQVNTAAGVDVSYGEKGVVASYVEFDNAGNIRKEYLRKEEVKFPYVPGYLAFRELPILVGLLRKVQKEGSIADVIFVDGNGLLHPRKAGLASHLGVVLNQPTVGIAKSLLCGSVELSGIKKGERRTITRKGEELGLAVKTYERANPVFISVGNRVGLDRAAELVREYSKYKLPEPLRLAHKLAKGKATESSPS